MVKVDIDALAEKFGGRFRLTVLLQKRIRELSRGAAPLVETESRNLIDIVLEEIIAGKVKFEGEEMAREAEQAARQMKGR